MNRYISCALLLFAAVSSSCKKDDVLISEDKIPITLSTKVEPVTKALVGSKKDDAKGFISIEDACDADGAYQDAIGFWTDMTYTDSEGNEQHRFDVFNTLGKETRLVYKATPESAPNKIWTYSLDAETQYWSRGARYNFVAYYPQSMSDYVLEGSSSTSVNTFVLTYNTHSIQEDLMVAYNEVYTVDPIKGGKNSSIYILEDGAGNADVAGLTTQTLENGRVLYGFDNDFNLDNKVPLHFKHTLAAVQVRFKFDYDDEDELVECWFENTATAGLHTVGTLVFGVGSKDALRPKTFPADVAGKHYDNAVEWEHDEKDDFNWMSYWTTHEKVKMYNWGVSDNEGIYFKHDGTVSQEAVAYVNEDLSGNPLNLMDESRQFTGHDGWFLIIPQKSTGVVKLFYRLKSSAGDVTSVTIPAVTGTNADGTVDKDNGEYYVAGHRYVYTVTINKTNAFASVQVTPWNELYSSTEIIF